LVARLAQFFPRATAVRIPVRLTGTNSHGNAFDEDTVIEYGTSSEVLFASTLPLEFGDRLRLENSDGSLHADTVIVAVQYHEEKRAVAARFARQISNWIIKP